MKFLLIKRYFEDTQFHILTNIIFDFLAFHFYEDLKNKTLS